VCGADVSERREDERKRERVQGRLGGEAAAAAAAAGDPASAASATAGVWLAAGLASVKGGNTEAGLARLGVAGATLERALASASASPLPAPSTTAATALLAAVKGSQGDCWRATGDVAAAAGAYGDAVAVLEGQLGGDSSGAGGGGGAPGRASLSLDLVHALAVTLSKLGDLEYGRAGPGAAARLYARALVARLRAGGEGVPRWAGEVADEAAETRTSASPPDPPTAATLRVDAALSAAKVGDALAAAGAAGGAAEATSLARALAGRAQQDVAAGVLDAGAAARLGRLRAFLEG